MKTLFDAIVAYCVGVPFHAILLLGIILLILGTGVALIIVAYQERNAAAELPPNPDAHTSRMTSSDVARVIAETTAETKEYEDPNELEEVDETQEDGEEEILPNPMITVTISPLSKSPNRRKQGSKGSKKVKAGNEGNGRKRNNHNKLKKIETTDKENAMLLDELKDINTDFDFYEEDETDKMARYSGKWVICRIVTNDSANEELFFFELRSAKGEQLLSSEEYTSYNSVLRGIETHKANILRNNFRILPAKNGGYTFKILNGKGMFLCLGGVYPTKEGCEQALELIKRFARTAFIDENIQDVVVKAPEGANEVFPPIPDGHDGKWVIDCRTLDNGERVYYFELRSERDVCLLTSEEYSSYIGAINSIQTYKTNVKNGNVRISLTKQGDYVFKLLNGNGQLLCLSNHYRTKRLCEYVVEVIKAYAIDAPVLTDPDLMQE